MKIRNAVCYIGCLVFRRWTHVVRHLSYNLTVTLRVSWAPLTGWSVYNPDVHGCKLFVTLQDETSVNLRHPGVLSQRSLNKPAFLYVGIYKRAVPLRIGMRVRATCESVYCEEHVYGIHCLYVWVDTASLGTLFSAR